MLIALWFCAARPAAAQEVTRYDNDPPPPPRQVTLFPMAFYSNSTEFAAGGIGLTVGVGQPQLLLGGAAFGSTNGSFGLYFINRDFQFQGMERLFMDSWVFASRFAESDQYIDGNPDFPDQQAGTNDSSEDNFIVADTYRGRLEAKFKYLLPIGDGADQPIDYYDVKNGELVEGASGAHSYFNPFASGNTYLELTPFALWRHVIPDGPEDSFDANTFGLRFGVRWNNTDFRPNPSRGNELRVELTRDFGIFNSAGAYTAIEAEYAHFIPVGSSEWFSQQVVALNLWTVAEISGEAPYYTGATLGGFNRFRGYPFTRFHDNSAIVGTAELRLTLASNPIAQFQAIDRWLQTRFVQLVCFGEVGRVGSNYSADELLTDLKWDAGVGVRVLARRAIVRFDLAFSEEDVQFWIMAGHAF